MKPDAIEESVGMLDELIRRVARPFPNIDVLPEGKVITATLAIASFIVDKTTIDYGRDDFKDYDKFVIVTNLVSRSISNEINEFIPINKEVFSSLFRSLMIHKFRFLFNTNSIVADITCQSDTMFSREITDMIFENKSNLISYIIMIKES
jgi:hypothetical protein